MKQKKIIIIILTFFLFSPNIGTYPIIRLSMKQLLDPERVLKSMKKSTANATYTVQGLHNYIPTQGIFSIYAGFLNNSDYNGQTLFPLKHKGNTLYILITKSLEPITMFGNTIHHWEVLPAAPARFFKCELTANNNKEQFWHIQEVPLPENNVIPLEAIVIIADPRYVTVPTGTSIATKGPNLILPDIYITKGIDIAKNTAYLLNMRHLFGTVVLDRQKHSKMYQVGITE